MDERFLRTKYRSNMPLRFDKYLDEINKMEKEFSSENSAKSDLDNLLQKCGIDKGTYKNNLYEYITFYDWYNNIYRELVDDKNKVKTIWTIDIVSVVELIFIAK